MKHLFAQATFLALPPKGSYPLVHLFPGCKPRWDVLFPKLVGSQPFCLIPGISLTLAVVLGCSFLIIKGEGAELLSQNLGKHDYFLTFFVPWAINQLANPPSQGENPPFMAADGKCEQLQQIKAVFLALFQTHTQRGKQMKKQTTLNRKNCSGSWNSAIFRGLAFRWLAVNNDHYEKRENKRKRRGGCLLFRCLY